MAVISDFVTVNVAFVVRVSMNARVSPSGMGGGTYCTARSAENPVWMADSVAGKQILRMASHHGIERCQENWITPQPVNQSRLRRTPSLRHHRKMAAASSNSNRDKAMSTSGRKCSLGSDGTCDVTVRCDRGA